MYAAGYPLRVMTTGPPTPVSVYHIPRFAILDFKPRSATIGEYTAGDNVGVLHHQLLLVRGQGTEQVL